MEGIVTTVNVTEGVALQVRNNKGVVIADRLVSDREEILKVSEGDRKGRKLVGEIVKGGKSERQHQAVWKHTPTTEG